MNGTGRAFHAYVAILGLAFAGCATAQSPQFNAQTATNPWNIDRNGTGARFELRPGDRAPYDPQGKERAELALTAPLLFNQTYDLSFRMKVEPGEPNDAKWLVFLQLQSTFDKGQQGHSPPVAMELVNERYRIVCRSGNGPVVNNQGLNFKELYHSPSDIVRGQWYDFRLKFRFDRGATGVLQVWQDGNQVVDYAGPLGFPDKSGPIIRYGLYRDASDHTLAIQFADLHLSS